MPSSLKAVARRVLPHSIYRRYRKRKIAGIIDGYTPHEVTHLYGDQTLTIQLADPLAEAWYDSDWKEPEMIGFLREQGVLVPGARVFDLGAHQAVVALMLARAAGGTGHVVAVEAEPHNVRVASVNRDLNDARNVTVVHAAGAASEGVTTFAEGLTGRVDERTAAGNITVPTVTIDGLARTYGAPDLVLIDVEGYEEQVLAGAADTLANGSASFLVEVHDAPTLANFGASSQAVVDLFGSYDTYIAAEDDDPFIALDGPLPGGRFFLAALPPRRRSATALS